MMAYRQTEKTRERVAQTRARVLKGALEQAELSGLDFRVNDAAERAGVAVGTIYRHFPDQHELVAAVMAHRLACDLAAMRVVALGKTLPGFAAAMMVYVYRLGKSRPLAVSLTTDPGYRIGITRELARLLVSLASNHEIAPFNAELAAMALYGALSEVAIGAAPLRRGKLDEPALILMALRAIGVDGARARNLACEAATVAKSAARLPPLP